MNKTTQVKHKSWVKYTLDDTVPTNYNHDRKTIDIKCLVNNK